MPLDFTFLRDDVAPKDLVEDSPHTKIANKLYELIADNNIDGLTVGIEGKWGSGKSTVIQFLRKKCEKNNIFVFYMDAWAHEGDHLRRIFLEEFITQAQETIPTPKNWKLWKLWKDKKNWKDKKDKKDWNELENIKLSVTNKRITKETKSTQRPTLYGGIAAFCMLLIPVGSAIVRNTIPYVTIKRGYEPHLEFLVGLGLLLSPFLVCLVCWLIITPFQLLFKVITNKKNAKIGNFSFWQKNATETYTNETSQEEERSSVEFSKFFHDSLAILDGRGKKTVCVIDNLDRINVDDALKIWSTLQTFVQNKNPTNEKENLKKLWILVPYDESGLRKLWNKSVQEPYKTQSDNTIQNEVVTENTQSDKEKLDNYTETGCAKFFFDKCFQLRVEVPSLILSGWVDYTKKMLNKAFPTWEDIDKKKIMDILKGTRERIDDIPSPRDIKMYINQIGLLRSLLKPLHKPKIFREPNIPLNFKKLINPKISLEAIAIYCVEKYLRDKSNEIIKQKLIDKKIPEKSLSTILNINEAVLLKEISAILFQVPKEKGMQILLQEPIETAVLENKPQDLQELKEQHQSVFWDVLNYLLDHEPNKPMSYVHNIYEAFENQEEYKKSHLAKLINRDREKIIKIISSMDDLLDIEKFISILLVAKTAKNENDNYRDFIEVYSNRIYTILEDTAVIPIPPKKKTHITVLWDDIKKVTRALNDNTIKLLDYSKMRFDGFARIVHAITSDDYTQDIIIKTITKVDQLDKDIAEKIIRGEVLATNLPKMIEVGCLAGFSNWNETIAKIIDNFQFSNFSQNQILNQVNIELLEALQYTKLDVKNTEKMKDLILSKNFWHCVGHHEHNKAIKLVASFLLGKYGDNLHIPNIPTLPDIMTTSGRDPRYFSSYGYRDAKNIWVNYSSADADADAKYMLNLARHTQDYEFIKELAKDPINLLASNIIEIAREEGIESFL